MGRIRLEPDGHDRYQVILPGINSDYPIGAIWIDSFQKPPKWKAKAYFPLYIRGLDLEYRTYDDSMKAARELAMFFRRNENSTITRDDPFELYFNDGTAD